MSYRVAVTSFQGPLDLLLQLIENQKLAITAVAITEVTGEYLSYLEELEQVSPRELNWFIEIASRLIYIKSRALIPTELEQDEEAADLTAQIAEYQRYKQAALKLRDIQRQNGSSHERVGAKPEPGSAVPANLDLPALQSAMQTILSRLPDEPTATIDAAVTLDEMIQIILSQTEHQPLRLSEATDTIRSRSEAIVFFIALLELIKTGAVRAKQVSLFDDIMIETAL